MMESLTPKGLQNWIFKSLSKCPLSKENAVKSLSDDFDPTADPADMSREDMRDLIGDDEAIDPDEFHEAHVPHPSLSDYERNGNFQGWPFK